MIKRKNTTCFNEHKKRSLACRKSSCNFWVDCRDNLNCVIVASSFGERTLQQIGNIYNLTRMRICQIEKSALKKIKDHLKD